jgi:hypothetical protein
MRMRTIGKALLLAMAVSGIAALSVAQTAQKPRFEVASVKPAPTEATTMRLGSSGGTFFADNLPLRMLLESAYRPADGSPLMNNRIIAAPSWIDTDRFDVEGKIADVTLWRACLLGCSPS